MDLKFLNALNKIPGLGPASLRKLLAYFDSAEMAWQAELSDLARSGIGENLAQKIAEERKKINPDEEMMRLEKENIKILLLDDADYPSLLKEIHNPPFLLYVRGEMDFNSAPMISIVGSRKFTEYGLSVTQKFSRELTQAGFIIVSGMALGIDAIAHQAALDANGKTVAVLGSSVDDKNIFPRHNFNLGQDIIRRDALLSDYPVETPAAPGTFPARNRIIAGMSLGTLVIEAGEKSGTLITAGLALEYNREVFAVPGPIFSPQSIGTHELIKKGAKLVSRTEDILEELNLETETEKEAPIQRNPDTPQEKIILEILTHEPLHIDNIAKLSKLGTSAAASTLAMMEIKGWVRNIGGQNYILT